MVPRSRRELLRNGAIAGGFTLAGCLGFGTGSECTTGRTRYVADASLPGNRSWPTYRFDAGNTGYNPDATVPDEVAIRWRYTACSEVESGVAVANGQAYPGAAVLDGRAGTHVAGEWHGYQTTPTLVDGVRYVGTHDLVAFDAQAATKRWTFDPDGEAGGISPPKAGGDHLYVTGNLDVPVLYAVDAADGTERWRFDPGARLETTPAVADGTVFVVDEDGSVHALDGATGEKRWTSADSNRWAGPPAVADGTVYVPSENGLGALDATDGHERWRSADASSVRGPVAVADRTVVAAGTDGRLLAVGSEDGSVRWETTIGNGLGPPTVAGETVLVGEAAGTRLAARSLEDGSTRWNFETRGVSFGDYTRVGTAVGPTAVGETVLVPTTASDLYALGRPTATTNADGQST